jgi:ketosteroid isomerase-like protein
MTNTKVDDALLDAIAQAFNSRDIDRIMEFFAEDAVFATARGPHPYGERYVGKPAIGRFLGDRFKSIPDMRWENQYRFVSGDRAVSCWIVEGKNPAGESLNFFGCDLYTFRDGKIVYKDTYWKSSDEK